MEIKRISGDTYKKQVVIHRIEAGVKRSYTRHLHGGKGYLCGAEERQARIALFHLQNTHARYGTLLRLPSPPSLRVDYDHYEESVAELKSEMLKLARWYDTEVKNYEFNQEMKAVKKKPA